MSLSFEALLIVGIFFFYIYDSVILVSSNQLFFIKSLGRWSVSFPSDRWRIMGKMLHIPNPATPYNLLFIASLDEPSGTSRIKSKEMTSLMANVNYIQIFVMLLMLLMLIVFPLVTYNHGLGSTALIILMLIYLTIIVMICYLYIKKEFYGLSNTNFTALAFESIACPPFALNILRKLSLKCPFQQDPIKFAVKNLDVASFKTFKEQLAESLAEQLEWEVEECSPRSLYLGKYRKKLMRAKQ